MNTAATLVDVEDVAVIYGRQSKDKRKSIDEQIDESRDAIDENGWRFGGIYSDGSSASRFATKNRPDWDRLLADLSAGRFGVLILWEPSRGDRRLSTWAAMLELCADRGVRIYVVSHERLYDPRNGRDWKALAEDGTDSAYESEKTSKRSKRNTDALAKKGRPHGMVAYGYRRARVFDDAGRLIDSRDEIVPEQAELIRETARRLLAGESMRSIVKSLNERGELSPKGKPWESTTLRQIMLRDRNAGLRRHRGKVVGKAAWEPIYDEGTHDRVVALLTDPARLMSKGAPRRHLLSGIARCGECEGPMRATPQTVYRGKTLRPKYQCKQCLRVACIQENVDDVVTAAVLDRLRDPASLRALATGRPERAVELRKLIDDAAAQMDRAVDKMMDGTWSESQVDRLNARLMPQVEAWRSELTTCAPRDGLLDLMGVDADANWDAAPLDVKRMAIDLLMDVKVLKSGPGVRFTPERIAITPKNR